MVESERVGEARWLAIVHVSSHSRQRHKVMAVIVLASVSMRLPRQNGHVAWRVAASPSCDSGIVAKFPSLYRSRKTTSDSAPPAAIAVAIAMSRFLICLSCSRPLATHAAQRSSEEATCARVYATASVAIITLSLHACPNRSFGGRLVVDKGYLSEVRPESFPTCWETGHPRRAPSACGLLSHCTGRQGTP